MCCYVIPWNGRQFGNNSTWNWNLQWIPPLIYDAAMLVELLLLLRAGRPNLTIVAWCIIITDGLVEHWVFFSFVLDCFAHFAGFGYFLTMFSSVMQGFWVYKSWNLIAHGCNVFCYAAPLYCTEFSKSICRRIYSKLQEKKYSPAQNNS